MSGSERQREKERRRERKREGARERRRGRGDEIDWCNKFNEKRGRGKERGKQQQDQQSCGFWIGHNFSNCVFFSLSFSRSLAPSLHMHFPVFASVKKTQSVCYIRVFVGVCRHDRREWFVATFHREQKLNGVLNRSSLVFYRVPCSALAKKSLRIHDPALTPGLGSENGYTFIFQATKGKET